MIEGRNEEDWELVKEDLMRMKEDKRTKTWNINQWTENGQKNTDDKTKKK